MATDSNRRNESQTAVSTREWLVPLGLVAVGVVANGLIVSTMTPKATLGWWFCFLAGMVLVEPILLAGWLIWTRQVWHWRLPLVLLASLCLAVPWQELAPSFFIALWLETGVVGWLLFVARIVWSRELVCQGQEDQQATNVVRYNLRYLFLWTTLIAFGLTVAVLPFQYGELSVDDIILLWIMGPAMAFFLLLSGYLALVPLLMGWSAMILCRLPVRLLVLVFAFVVVVAATVAGLAVWGLAPADRGQQLPWLAAAMIAVPGSLLYTTLFATTLRLAGYYIRPVPNSQ